MGNNKRKYRQQAYRGGRGNSSHHHQSDAASKRRREQVNDTLESGMTGFLVTCGRNNERRCVNDCYTLLNEYYDKFFADTIDPTTAVEEEASESQAKIEIQQALAQRRTRFQSLRCGVKQCIFIMSSVERPSAFIHRMLSDLAANSQSKSRYIERMLPVVATCRPTEEAIREAIRASILPFFVELAKKTCGVLGRAESMSTTSGVEKRVVELEPKPETSTCGVIGRAESSTTSDLEKCVVELEPKPEMPTPNAKTDSDDVVKSDAPLTTKSPDSAKPDSTVPTFMIIYKVRNTESAPSRDEIIRIAIDALVDDDAEPSAIVCRPAVRNPTAVISVDVLRTVCCISFCPDYQLLRKYNINSFSSDAAKTDQGVEKKAEAGEISTDKIVDIGSSDASAAKNHQEETKSEEREVVIDSVVDCNST